MRKIKPYRIRYMGVRGTTSKSFDTESQLLDFIKMFPFDSIKGIYVAGHKLNPVMARGMYLKANSN